MGSLYPGGSDSFSEPSLPEETTLSSAGSGSRTHFEHHRDLGDAIEALQAHASQKTHAHDGTDTPTGGPKLLAANTHESVDTDASQAAIHHTLGLDANQAAPGNHIHSYGDLTNRPFEVCLSTARPTAPIPGMLIYEIDTNRMRVWTDFANNQLAPGLLSADFFERANVTNLGTSLWEQTYTFSPTTRGRLAIPDGHNASWIDQSGDPNRVLARRINTADAETMTDNQAITWKIGEDEGEHSTILDEATNDAYLRLSADKRHFIRIRVAQGYLIVFYTTNGWGDANEKELGRIYTDTRGEDYEWRAEIEDYDLRIYRNSDHVGTITDKGHKSTKGPGARGWGFGMEAGDRLLWGQITPADLQWIRIADLPTYTSITRWSLLPVADKPVILLQNNLKQQLTYTGTDIQWMKVVEDNFGMFNKLDPTKVTITEPGLYHFDAALQWDPNTVPDTAHGVIVVNNQETVMRDSKAIKGGLFTPGFSQSLNISGKMRLAIGDVVTVRAKYTAPNGLLTSIFSWFDGPSRVNSRLEMTYLSV